MNAWTPRSTDHTISVKASGITLKGLLGVPLRPTGVILFAHGSGSGRLRPRNTAVARGLQTGGLATLLVDLLEESEVDDRRKVFDIHLLADRLLAAKAWLSREISTRTLPVGYFGASTGARSGTRSSRP